MGDVRDRSYGAPPVVPGDDRIESWKEIAAYLKRDVATVQRWEKREGLPVHRLPHDKLGSVFAFKSELDAWRDRGRNPTATRERPARLRHSARIGRIGVVAVIAVAAMVAGAVWWLTRSRSSSPAALTAVTRLVLPIDAYGAWHVAVSPDGSHIVYGVTERPLRSRLYTRALDEFEAHPIPGTDGGNSPFFSPDGKWLGFFVGEEMRKVGLTGGAPVTIAKAVNNRGATWTIDDTIIFAPDTPGGLARVAAAGGVPQMLTQPDYAAGEKTHRYPHTVPGGKFVIFTTAMADQEYDDARVEILNLETGERRVLFEGGTDARYVPTGHIVFARLGSLYAIRFDLDRLRVIGSPHAVLDNISGNIAIGRAYYAVSDTGTLAYARGGAWKRSSRLVLVDRSGRVVRTIVDHPRLLLGPKLSPDGKHLVATAFGANYQVWVFDLMRGSSTRITTAWDNEWPVWSHDGTRVMFSSTRGGVPHLHAQNADGAKTSDRLSANPGSEFATSPDGEAVASVISAGQSNSDIASLRPANNWVPEPLIQEPGNQRYPRFSPDGRWLAYMSDETGRFEVYIRPYPSLDRKWSVSTTGGRVPVWSRDGREVFFRDVSRFYSASIQTSPLRIGEPKLLFENASYEPGVFDVTPDGHLLLTKSDANQPREIAVVVNWFAELAK